MTKKIIVIITAVLLIIMTSVLFFLSVINCDSQKLIKKIENNDIKGVERVLKQGVDPNLPDMKINTFWSLFEISPDTPLTVACKTGNSEIVELLIEYGATAKYQNGTGWSALRETLFYYQPNDDEIVELLLKNGGDPNLKEDKLPVYVAAEMMPKIYDKSKKNGTVFVSGYDERTAIEITNIVKLLMENTTIEEVNKSEILISAVKNGNIYLANFIISEGADIHYVDSYKKTALDYAMENGNEEMIQLLIKAKTGD